MKKRTMILWAMALVLGLVILQASVSGTPAAQSATLGGAELLQRALERAQQADGYRMTLDVQQTVLPVGALTEQSARFRIEGDIAGPQQARLTIRDGDVRGGLAQNAILASPTARELLIAGDALYQRESDAWVKQPESLTTPGLNSDGLALLQVARDVRPLDPIETLGGRFERVAFTLESRDVLRFMLRQSGYADPETELRLALSGVQVGGTGELWVDAAGLPARLTLTLALARGGREGYQARAVSTALYSDFGATFPAGWFDPTRTPLSQVSTLPIPGVRVTREQLWTLGLFAASLALGGLLWMQLLRRKHLARQAMAAVSAVLIITLLSPLVAQAAQGQRAAAATTTSAVESLAANAAALGARQRARIAAAASTLDPLGDEDGDGLPNGYELRLGTNPFAADTDFDGLTDYEEVMGVECFNGATLVRVETDPLNPDSNYDGIRDGNEFDRGACRFTARGNRPFAWDDDNDSDGVPDDLDLSPFTVSPVFEAAGANLSFETLYSLPGVPPREVYYFEVQIVPANTRTLQFAYKSALEWPVDDKGMIQHDPNSGTTGRLQLAPFLEATLDNNDLPSEHAMAQYGLAAVPIAAADGTPTDESTLVIPLAPVERGGIIYAFQAKMLQDMPGPDGVIRWRNLRLKWGVQGDVLRADDDGNMVPSPTGSYGLVVYDEPYRITGVQTSRQGGASSLVAGAIREAGADAAAVTLLRGALETQFLGGRLNLGEIYNRFELGSTATITERWGITQTFIVSLPDYFSHVDEMILTTNVTTTRSLLDAAYSGGGVRPTLLIATEQRTATLNVDDLPNPNFDNLLLNLCVTQMVTSRSLKLASYRWDPSAGVMAAGVGVQSAGDWVMLGLDEVLKDIQQQFDALYSVAEAFYNETLTLLQLAMTAWYQGQTVIQAIGDLALTDVANVLDDAAFYTQILDLLDAAGLFDGLPQEFRPAVEFLLGVLNYPGGPAQWLEDQWNTVVALGEGLVGGFKNFAAGDFAFTPDSLLSFTQTAINVLTWLASIFDFGFLGDAVKVLTTLLDVFNRVQQLWATIQVLVEHGAAVAVEVLTALASELGALSNSLQVVGVIFSVVSSLLSLFFQLALGNLSVLGIIAVVLKAVVEIAIAIVLFVVATIFPVGTLIALAIGIVRAVAGFLKDWFGDVGTVLAWILDPLGSFLDAVNPDPEPLVRFLGNPRLGELQFRTFPDAPLGGFIAGDRFAFSLPGIVTLSGETGAALNRSHAWVRLGRYAGGGEFEVCGLQIVQYLIDTGQLDMLPSFTNAIVWNQCTTFRARYEPTWTYSHEDSFSASAPYFTDKIPGTAISLPFNFLVRDYYSAAQLNVNPRTPQINGVVLADISLDVALLWENCGILGLDCDQYADPYTTPPSVNYIYLDILPRTLAELWDWDDLRNHDPDGDGLPGNQDQGIIGFDNGLCGFTNSHLKVDSEPIPDGLSDTFELLFYSSSPCLRDTDNDGLTDYEEFILGTDPRNPDTDGDGLKDGEEVARWNPGWLVLSVPWRVDMQGAYPGLPNPAAFPNPRIANADRDGRSDKKEKELFSSPNAFDVSDMDIAIAQELLPGGGTRIRLTTFPWNNDDTVAASPVFTLTLPIGFSGVTTSARVLNKSLPTLNPVTGTPVAGTPPNVYAWTFPPLTLNRMVQVTFAGLPATLPAGEVQLDAAFSYTEATVPRQVATTAPLRLNRGGPVTAITWPAAGGIVSALNGPVRLQGTADDPEGVSSVQVCITTGGACAAGDWKPAVFGSLYSLGWTYDWTPPANGAYTARARATDAYGVAGQVSAPVAFFVDSTPPAAADFDLSGTVYVSTTFSVDSLAAFTVTGQITDAPGAYVSGVGGAQVVATLTTPEGAEILRGESVVTNPGAQSSAFRSRFSLPAVPFGGAASPYAEGAYQLQLSANDRAGNVRLNSDALTVIVDDTPPFVTVRAPQTVLGATFDLGGRADDTALSLRRAAPAPYPVTQTLATRDTVFNVLTPTGRAYLVGDVNGDTLDDVLVVAWESRKALEAGLFFGRTTGFPATLDLAQADVFINGEADFGGVALVPAAAHNAPGLLDVNGDGIADLLIGDPNAGGGAGRAYVLLGRRAWPTTIALASADWRLSVPQTVAFGATVASAGDVDGDGLADLAIGAVAETTASAGVNNEVLFLYLGRERGVPPLHGRFFGRNCRAGCASPRAPQLAGLGDTNGDGLSDVLLAGVATTWLIGGRPKGELPLSAAAEDYALAAFQGEGIQQTVSAVGDVNGDGLRDMLIGDPDGGAARVFVVFGRRPEQGFPAPPAPYNLMTHADLSFIGSKIAERGAMGLALAPLGDLDRDGKDDFAFGPTGDDGGASIVLSGKTPWAREQPSNVAAYTIIGGPLAHGVGRALSSGDANGDGIRDLLVGTPGASAALLFNGKSPQLTPSGVARVEVGIVGPITEPDKPITDTIPVVWIPATLAQPHAAATTFSVPLNFLASGDYRLYIRATDRALNRLPGEAWYVGTTFVNFTANEIPGLSSALDTLALFREGFLRVALTGTVGSPEPIQHVRIFDGERWTRLPLTADAPDSWTYESNIKRSDRREITFRLVARDVLGNVAHAVQTVITDTLVAAPVLFPNLSNEKWATNITPTLVITWPAVSDASGPVTRYAIIDQNPDTTPVTLVGANQVSRSLNAPGAWYAHVRVVDAVGNEQIAHAGPFGVNRTRTPSALLPDGWLDFAGNEYVTGMSTGYDPYAAFKPALLLATWDSDWLYLGFTGSQWSAAQRLVVYLESRLAGGITTSLGAALPGGEPVHTLPFAADFALALHGPNEFTLYTSASGSWVQVANPQSFAVTGSGAEIAINRAEIGAATGIPVELLAYLAVEEGIAAVIPASARPSTTDLLTGPVLFGDAIRWPSLRDGFPTTASELPVQRIAPLLSVNPGYATQLNPGETAPLVVSITNPDILSYRSHPLTVTLGSATPQVLEFVSLNGGATCVSCPANGREWVVSVNVPPQGTRNVAFTVRARNPGATGVFAAQVAARMAHQGLPVAPQPPATAVYTVDNSVAQVQIGLLGAVQFTQPGLFKLSLRPRLGNSVLACRQQLSVNRGAGWEPLGALGAVSSITANLPAGYNQQWQLRVTGPGGQTTFTDITVQTDASAPTVQVTPTPLLTRGASWLRGTASDNSGRIRAVELSLNGGPFRRARLFGDGSVRLSDVQSIGPIAWALPINTSGKDGERVLVVARAVDVAGNVSPHSAPFEVTLDAVGPALNITESQERAAGTASDGSGVARVQVSLDGGVTYQNATLVGEAWHFDYSAWTGGAPVGMLIVRAEDVHGNVSQAVALTAASAPPRRIFLPLVMRQGG